MTLGGDLLWRSPEASGDLQRGAARMARIGMDWVKGSRRAQGQCTQRGSQARVKDHTWG